MLRICRDSGGDEIDAQDVVERRVAAIPVALSDRHEYVLALFKYGLVDSARDLAIVMNVAEPEARTLCDELHAAGLLDASGS